MLDKFANVEISPEQREFHAQIERANVGLAASSDAATQQAMRLLKTRALLELDLPQKVLPVFKGVSPLSDAETAVLAYALYKTGDITALRALATHESSLGARLALAQAEYRAGSLLTARNLLLELTPLLDEESAEDAGVNVAAVDSLRGILPTDLNEDFDGLFNAACAYTARGDFVNAENALNKCRKFADGEEDAIIVDAQQTVIQLLSGNSTAETAEKLLKLSKNPVFSRAEQLVLRNNALAAQYTSNSLDDVHLALKTFDELPLCFAELNTAQKQGLNRNLLKLLSKAGVKTLKRAKKHAEQYPHDLEPLVLAYNYTQRPSEVRKLAEQGDLAAKLWVDAVNGVQRHVVGKDRVESGSLSGIFQAAERAYSSKTAENSDLESYFRSLPDNELQNAGLAILSTSSDSSSSPSLSSDVLASIDSLVAAKNVDSMLQEALQTTSSSSVSQTRHRNRNKRALPKSFDANKQPDPERWVAKMDRSGSKKKKLGMTQGAGTVDDTLESSIPVKQSTGTVVTSKPRKNAKRRGRK